MQALCKVPQSHYTSLVLLKPRLQLHMSSSPNSPPHPYISPLCVCFRLSNQCGLQTVTNTPAGAIIGPMRLSDSRHRKGRSDQPSLLPSRDSPLSDPDNDHLVETPRQPAVNEEIRREIERRFVRSHTNATFVFPRALKAGAAPHPPRMHRAGDSRMLVNAILRKDLGRSLSNSRNSSASRIRNYSTLYRTADVSLNASFQTLPGHRRDVSLTKQLPRNQRVPSKARPVVLKAKAVARPKSKAARKSGPSSLNSSMRLKTAHSRPFVDYERL